MLMCRTKCCFLREGYRLYLLALFRRSTFRLWKPVTYSLQCIPNFILSVPATKSHVRASLGSLMFGHSLA